MLVSVKFTRAPGPYPGNNTNGLNTNLFFTMACILHQVPRWNRADEPGQTGRGTDRTGTHGLNRRQARGLALPRVTRSGFVSDDTAGTGAT